MVLHFYALTANAIHYGQTHPVFVVQEGTFYLSILLYMSFARTYLSVTKFVL